jgi:putative tryptophan/tyrosine transport system substrate-binding protein
MIGGGTWEGAPMFDMRRREFITLLGGAAAWPMAAQAQQPAMPHVGFLHPRSRADATTIIAAFGRGLRETGFVEGENLAIEYRFGDGQPTRLPILATDLIQRHVAVIAAGPRVGEVLKDMTGTIPIVFLSGGDPVRTGLVASLNRPGGHLTGVSLLSLEIEAKRLGLLHDLIPRVSSIAVLADATNASMDFQVQQIQTAARDIGMSIRVVTVGNEADLEPAIATAAREGTGALIVTSSTYFLLFRDRLAALAARHKIAAIYELREYAKAGGLMSYGPSNDDAWRQIGVYTGRILKGEKPTDLPVVQPTRFELVINLKTAKALGLQVPDKLLALADEVIE